MTFFVSLTTYMCDIITDDYFQDPLLQEFLKMINEELKLNCIHARYSKKGNAWLYLTFPTQSEQGTALKLLKKYNWKGRSLISTVSVHNFLLFT